MKKSLVQTIRNKHSETYLNNPEVPVIFSNITNWEPKPFMTVLDFLNTLQPEEPPYEKFEEDAIAKAKTKFKFKYFEHLNDRNLAKVNHYMDQEKEDFYK